MRLETQPGWLLHQRPWRESSRILDVLTAEHGRVGIVARGLRRRRSTQPELFQPLLWNAVGRGELLNLQGCESQQRLPALMGEALYAGFYLNEILLRVSERNEHQAELFALYSQSMAELVTAKDWVLSLRCFEKGLLDALGYGLSWHVDVAGHAIQKTEHYRCLAGRGFEQIRVAGETSSNVGPSALSHASTPMVAGEMLLAVANDDWTPAVGEAIRPVLQPQLQAVLGDKPLHSRELIRAHRRQKPKVCSPTDSSAGKSRADSD